MSQASASFVAVELDRQRSDRVHRRPPRGARVEPMHQVLDIAPSTYWRHKQLQRPPERRSEERAIHHEELTEATVRIRADNYGVRLPGARERAATGGRASCCEPAHAEAVVGAARHAARSPASVSASAAS
jgi:hypothetical protein